ncbi:hypothetical protein HDU77_011044 [Chytriomyces hyalinus]|nr:hypothetical protein HDU77_011044 [Chytriomyces hyalinus]
MSAHCYSELCCFKLTLQVMRDNHNETIALLRQNEAHLLALLGQHATETTGITFDALPSPMPEDYLAEHAAGPSGTTPDPPQSPSPQDHPASPHPALTQGSPLVTSANTLQETEGYPKLEPGNKGKGYRLNVAHEDDFIEWLLSVLKPSKTVSSSFVPFKTETPDQILELTQKRKSLTKEPDRMATWQTMAKLVKAKQSGGGGVACVETIEDALNNLAVTDAYEDSYAALACHYLQAEEECLVQAFAGMSHASNYLVKNDASHSINLIFDSGDDVQAHMVRILIARFALYPGKATTQVRPILCSPKDCRVSHYVPSGHVETVSAILKCVMHVNCPACDQAVAWKQAHIVSARLRTMLQQDQQTVAHDTPDGASFGPADGFVMLYGVGTDGIK